MLLMLSAFSLDAVAYAFVGQLLYVSCMNHIVFNLGPKLYEVEIICDQPQEIERFIIQDIRKSATIDQVVGSYSGQSKTQLDCVCTSREYVRLREFIRDGGYDCFIKVYPLTHVFGHNKDFHHLPDKKENGPLRAAERSVFFLVRQIRAVCYPWSSPFSRPTSSWAHRPVNRPLAAPATTR